MLLELKIVISGSNGRFLENFVFIIISQCFHIARIKMYCMTLFLQPHSCPISRKYCADLCFKSLTLFEWKYLKTLISPLFSIPSRSNPYFQDTINMLCYKFFIFQTHSSTSCLHLSTALPTRGFYEAPFPSVPDEAQLPHNSSITDLTILQQQNNSRFSIESCLLKLPICF